MTPPPAPPSRPPAPPFPDSPPDSPPDPPPDPGSERAFAASERRDRRSGDPALETPIDTPAEALHEAAPAGPDWQRLHGAALVHFTVQGFWSLVKTQAQGLLAGGAAVGLTAGSLSKFLLLLGAGLGAVLVGVTIWAVLAYRRFRFRLGVARFDLFRGVVNRERLSLDLERVQTVNLDQPAFFRPFGLFSVSLETAGSSGREVRLPGVSRAFADRLRNRVRAAGGGGDVSRAAAGAAGAAGAAAPIADTGPGTEATADQDASTLLWRARPGHLVRHGLVGGGGWWLLPGLGVAMGWAGERGVRWGLTLADDNPSVRQVVAWFADLGVWVAACILVVASLAAVLALVVAASVAAALVTLHGYRLVRLGDGFQRRCGLIESRERLVRDAKVQFVRLRQGPLAQIMGLRVAEIVQAGGATAHFGSSGAGPLLIPALPPAELTAILCRLDPALAELGERWGRTPRVRSDPVYVLHVTLLWGAIPAAVGGGVAWVAGASLWALLSLAWPVVVAGAAALVRARAGLVSPASTGPWTVA
ncbi:hypothetical protein CCR80_05570 [Rhodothalassium salexigens]|nr:PH domain-containing protein [Rhodothalassium salexigens]MBK5920510.1 hypothetical protein [Rhodothalassium salexigens]